MLLKPELLLLLPLLLLSLAPGLPALLLRVQ